jgi:multiple sugar transport system substrate-binding protein
LITLDDPRTVAGLRFLRRLLDQGLVSPDVVSYEWDRPIRMLATGEASLSFGGSYEGRTLATMTGIELQRLTEQFVFAPMPAGPHGPAATLAGGMSYAIFRQAHDPKQAMGVLEHLLDADALTRMARETGQIPPRQSLAIAVGAEVPFLADTVSMLNRTVVRPAIPAHARVSSQLQSMFEGVLTGRFGPAAAAERTAELVGAITGLEPA